MSKQSITDKIAALSPDKRALLATKITQQQINKAVKDSIPQTTEKRFVTLSGAQKRLWNIQQQKYNSPVFNAFRSWNIKGVLDVNALQNALNTLVARHDALRSAFTIKDGALVQGTISSAKVSLAVIDIGKDSHMTLDDSVFYIALQEVKLPFDLTQAPLFRIKLIRLSRDEHILILTFHHIVVDGWSIGIFHKELSLLYSMFSIGNSVSLDNIPFQYKDYLLWQHNKIQNGSWDIQIGYWKKKLLGSPYLLSFPFSRPRPSVQSFKGDRHCFTLSDSLVVALKSLGGNAGTTLFMTLLSSFQTLLFSYTGQKKIVVGSPIANRNLHKFEGVMGLFVNPLVYCVDFSGNPSFRDILNQMRGLALGAYVHQELPFDILVESIQVPHYRDRHSLFQVGFTLQNTHFQNLDLPGLQVRPYKLGSVSPFEWGNNTSKLDLNLSLVEIDNGLKGMFEYSTDLFSAAMISQMTEDLKILLQAMVEDPDCCITM